MTLTGRNNFEEWSYLVHSRLDLHDLDGEPSEEPNVFDGVLDGIDDGLHDDSHGPAVEGGGVAEAEGELNGDESVHRNTESMHPIVQLLRLSHPICH